MREIVYIDMDGVLVDFKAGIDALAPDVRQQYPDNVDEVPGIFENLRPMPGAIHAYNLLAKFFDTYILSTPPWGNPEAWTHKVLWVQKHLGEPAHKRLILSHHKHLHVGDYLIDDRTANGAGQFPGTHIHFGSPAFPDWERILYYLLEHRKLIPAEGLRGKA